MRTLSFHVDIIERVRVERDEFKSECRRLHRIELEHAELRVIRRGEAWKDSSVAVGMLIGGCLLSVFAGGMEAWPSGSFWFALGWLLVGAGALYQLARSFLRTP